MGKMTLGGPTRSPRREIKAVEVATVNDTRLQDAMDRINEIHSEVFKKLAKLEAQELPVATNNETIIVEKTEVVKEVSVSTLDKRARKHSGLVSDRVKAHAHAIKILNTMDDVQSIDIKNLQDLVGKLNRRCDEIYEKERKLEVQISEENQPVKQPTQMLPMILSGLALAASLLTLIIK